MRVFGLKYAALAGVCLLASNPASAICFPVTTDIVSLGEKTALAYAQRSMTRNIEEEKERITGTGGTVQRVTGPDISCQPFPNLIGADEWRCVGSAKVCTK